MKSYLLRLLPILMLATLCGCEENHLSFLEKAPEPVVLPTPKEKPTKISYQPLQLALARVINKSGYILAYQYPFIEQNLIKQLQIFSAVGPATTPDQFKTPASRLAYWYNVRTAWIIKMAMLHHRTLFSGKADYTVTLKIMKKTKYPIDGQLMLVSDVDNRIREIGGFMAEISAPGGTLDRAPMPQTPFEEKQFPACIENQFNGFVNSTSRFVCNVEKRQWYIPAVVWNYRKKLIDIYQANYPTPEATFTTVLTAWTSGPALYRLQNNAGYTCVKNPRKPDLAIINE